MRKRRGPRRRRKAGGIYAADRVVWPRLLAVLLVLAALILYLDARLRPTIANIATYQAKVFAVRSVNRAMLHELDASKITYDEMVHISQNRDGMVTSVQSDMVKINRLMEHVVQSITDDLDNWRQQTIRVPIGTLLGNEWLSGRGPKVEIKVIPTGYVHSEVYNQFNAAGINQTHHQVILKTTVQMMVILPGYSLPAETSSHICIAETVIVGTIPEAFTQIEGDDSPVVSKINDYGAIADD